MTTNDPADNLTFWHTNEYYPVTSSANWFTRIGKFQFPISTPTPTPTATPTPTPGPTPAAPTALKATNETASSFTANWTSVSGATGYRLDVSTNSSFTSYVP